MGTKASSVDDLGLGMNGGFHSRELEISTEPKNDVPCRLLSVCLSPFNRRQGRTIETPHLPPSGRSTPDTEDHVSINDRPLLDLKKIGRGESPSR